jgi:drug/metabolite transporter (DMT)-like permease
MGSNIQLVAAILLTAAAVMLFVSGRGREPGWNSGKQAGLLVGMAAAIFWVLYLVAID